MKGKLMLLTGLAVGYVLGAKAGRARYEQIRSASVKFWQSDAVQKPKQQVEDFMKDTAPELSAKLVDSTKKLIDTVTTKVQEIKTEAEKAAAAHEAAEKSAKPAASKPAAKSASRSTGSGVSSAAKKPAAGG